MLKKISVVLAIVAGLGLAAVSADAKQPNQGQNQGNKFQGNKFQGNKFQGNNNKFQGNKFQGNKFQGNKFQGNKFSGNNKFIVGKKYNGHVWYGQSRHRWRGTWYAYGEGPCWINIDGLWFWNPIACP